MIEARTLHALLKGDGLALAAREHWLDIPFADEVSFADKVGIAALRVGRPEWRARPLAPVSMVDPALTFRDLGDGSFDYVVAFHVFAQAAGMQGVFELARRLLRPARALIFAMPDERYLSVEDSSSKQLYEDLVEFEAALSLAETSLPWSAGRLARLIGALPVEYVGNFQIELLGRFGRHAIAVLSAGETQRYATGELLDDGTRVFLADGRFIRHVENPQTLELLIRGGLHLRRVDQNELAIAVVGNAMRAGDVSAFFERRRTGA